VTTRRRFLASAGLAAGGSLLSLPSGKPAAPPAGPMQKPRALKAGDTVGLIAPSSYIFDVWRIDDVAPRLAALGLKVKLGAHVRERRGYLAGTEEQRIADLHAMFRDPEVAAVFCLG
jgi:muramoyltetrapeptide carboxypeptidase